jgi:hypothetical protein
LGVTQGGLVEDLMQLVDISHILQSLEVPWILGEQQGFDRDVNAFIIQIDKLIVGAVER